MINIYSARQIPDTSRIGASFAWFRPIQFATKLCKPAKNGGILIDDANGNTLAPNDDASFTEKEASQHATVDIFINKKGSRGQWRIAPSIMFMEKETHSVSVNPKPISDFPGIGPFSIHGKDLVFVSCQYQGPNWRTQLHAIVHQEASNGSVRASEARREFVNRRTVLIGINNLFTVLFKNWINWFSTHIKHPYCLFKHILTYFLHNYNVCFKRVGRKKAGRLLDGQTWDEFPRQEVAG